MTKHLAKVIGVIVFLVITVTVITPLTTALLFLYLVGLVSVCIGAFSLIASSFFPRGRE